MSSLDKILSEYKRFRNYDPQLFEVMAEELRDLVGEASEKITALELRNGEISGRVDALADLVADRAPDIVALDSRSADTRQSLGVLSELVAAQAAGFKRLVKGVAKLERGSVATTRDYVDLAQRVKATNEEMADARRVYIDLDQKIERQGKQGTRWFENLTNRIRDLEDKVEARNAVYLTRLQKVEAPLAAMRKAAE